MSKFVTLVICKHNFSNRKYLFYAPPWLEFENNRDRVIVDTQYGQKEATVLSHCTVKVDSDEYKMIKELCGSQDELRKVIGIYKLYRFDREYNYDKEVNYDE